MNEEPSIEAHLALFAVGEALRARAEGMAAWHFLKSAGVPKEALDQAYFAAARLVSEEARGALKAQGVPPLVADTIADRLISGLPAEAESEPVQSADPN